MHFFRRGQVEKGEPHLEPLGRRAFLGSDGRDGRNGFEQRERRRLVSRECPVVHAHVVDQALESGLAATRADAERLFGRERERKLVEQNVLGPLLAVDIDVDVFRRALAVVGDQHVLPLVEFERPLGLQAQADVGPAAVDVEEDLALAKVQPVPLARAKAFGLRQDRAIRRGGANPRGEAEGIQEVELEPRAAVDVPLAVEAGGLPDASPNESRLVARIHKRRAHLLRRVRGLERFS